jgi:glycosyltransferase involved in cell wall biosynthesis
VTTRHGGYADAVSPAAARLVDADGDIASGLAAELAQLLRSPHEWPTMSRAGRAHVAARFELGACTADLDQLWLALASGARRRDLPEPHAPSPIDPRVSVVLVTHNRRALVERALDALDAQTTPADEVIVVDNGSDDGTGDVLAERAARGAPRGLRVIRRETNASVAEGRNLAVAASTGTVVAFTDDDCRPRPTWVETLVAGFRPGVGVVQGRTIPDPAQELGPLSRSQWTLAETGLYETCNVAYRRDVLDDGSTVGPFSLGFADVVARTLDRRRAHLPFGEDTELAWRVKRRGVPTRFATYAVVDHEVWPPRAALLLQRAAVSGAFPALVAQVPELRSRFLTAGVFLGPRRVTWWIAAGSVAAAAAARSPWPLLATLVYADRGLGLRDLGRPGHRRARIRAVPTLVRRDLAETVALVRGSWRARSLVL